MDVHFFKERQSSFQIIIFGFLGTILLGTFFLSLPAASNSGAWTSFEDALFTSTSAVCVTGLVVRDTSIYWSHFGQAVILILIQIGGLGVVSFSVFFALLSRRKIDLVQRNILLDSISAHQIGGVVKMTLFIFKTAFILETAGAIAMMPVFISKYGKAGIWLSVFHSVSAFCNAGFDIMGTKTGAFSSLTSFGDRLGIVIPVSLLILIGGVGFLTWDDVVHNGFHFKKYRMQSKTILVTSAFLIIIPAVFFYIFEFSDSPLKERICLSVFQAVTPRTAGFNTADISLFSGCGRVALIALMLIGGSPGSTAGGMKTTTLSVLVANSIAVFRRKKTARLFGRRIEDNTIRTASTLLIMYLLLFSVGAILISTIDGIPISLCMFETASAIGTVGLSLGITADFGFVSHLILVGLMFLGRVGGLTLMYATIYPHTEEVSQFPIEKIIVG